MSEDLHNDEYQEDIEQDVDAETVDDEQDIDIDDSEQSDASDADDNQDDDGLDFSFDESEDEQGDPFAGQKAPEWVKQIRNENRELKRQQREWQQSQGQSQQQGLREKPTLDAHEYDSDAYEDDYAAWLGEKTQHDTQMQAETAKYQKYDDGYKTSVDAVRAKVPEYDEIEQSIVDALPLQRQAMIKMMTDNPARMVVALGKSPNKLQALSELDDMQFAKQIVLMEANMSNPKQNSTKPKPTSHKLQGSSGGNGDAQLAKLEAAADKSGDRSAIYAYKKAQRNK